MLDIVEESCTGGTVVMETTGEAVDTECTGNNCCVEVGVVTELETGNDELCKESKKSKRKTTGH